MLPPTTSTIGLLVDEIPPCHSSKSQPIEGFAVSFTFVPAGYGSVSFLETLPLPTTLIVILYSTGRNPSSIWSLQLLSRPSSISVAPGLIAAFPSLQSTAPQ